MELGQHREQRTGRLADLRHAWTAADLARVSHELLHCEEAELHHEVAAPIVGAGGLAAGILGVVEHLDDGGAAVGQLSEPWRVRGAGGWLTTSSPLHQPHLVLKLEERLCLGVLNRRAVGQTAGVEGLGCIVDLHRDELVCADVTRSDDWTVPTVAEAARFARLVVPGKQRGWWLGGHGAPRRRSPPR